MSNEAIEVMNNMILLDRDALAAYDEAIDACDNKRIKARLREFRGDHERHVAELSERVRAHGGEPKQRRDIKGFMIQGFTKVASRGDRSALLAMRGNEELTSRVYANALKHALPSDVRTLLRRNGADERRHLAWITNAMKTKAWERERVTTAQGAVATTNGRAGSGKRVRPHRIRYAVVGLGNIAQVAVLPAFAHARENSELAALVSSNPEKLKALGRRYNVALRGSYDQLEEILADGAVDAVYLAVPNNMHRKMTERAAKAGVHVLCEKPMAITTKDCEAMIRAARDNHVKLMIAYRLHFDRANLDAVERIRKGEIGAPRIFSSVFTHQVRAGDIRSRSDTGGGALYDMGVYCVNAARYLFQAEPEEVVAERFVGSDERFPRVDEMTTAVLRFSGNRVAQLTASQGAADVAEYRVVGSKGDLRLDPAFDYVTRLREVVTIDGQPREKTFAKSDQFAPELVYFSQCIIDDVEPEPSGEEGLADVRVLENIVRAAELGVKVKLDPFTRRDRPTMRLAMRKPPVRRVTTVHAPSPSA